MLTDRGPPPTVAREFHTWEAVYERQEKIYEGQIRYTDWLIERFASAIPERFEDALVVVTGDHRHLFYEEGWMGHHSSLHPGGIHVPLFISTSRGWDGSDIVIERLRLDWERSSTDVSYLHTVPPLRTPTYGARNGERLLERRDRRTCSILCKHKIQYN